jgi:hypothetical protein
MLMVPMRERWGEENEGKSKKKIVQASHAENAPAQGLPLLGPRPLFTSSNGYVPALQTSQGYQVSESC